MTGALLLLLMVQQPDPVSQYLEDLEKAGVLSAEGSEAAPSLERLKQTLRVAEDDLVTGNPQIATTRLVRIVEGPQWKTLAYSPEYENAELTLGRALVRAGAYRSARRYLARVLEHGPQHPYFTAAYRAMLDVALETREQAGVLAQLEGIKADPLPKDSQNERAYLRGKVAYERLVMAVY
jgi:hypothetical protein